MKKQTQRFSAVSKIAVIAIIIITLGCGTAFSQTHIFLNDKTDVFGVIIENNPDYIVLQDFENKYLKIRKEVIINMTPLYVNAKIFNGTNIIGKVTAMTDDAIRINSNYTTNKYDKSSVIFITPISFEQFIEANPVFEEINNFEVYNAPNKVKDEYFSFGVAIGYGGFPNILTSYNYSKNASVSLELGLLLILPNSIRLKQSFNIANTANFESNYSVSLGYFGIISDEIISDVFYTQIAPLALSYDINLNGFYGEIGLAYNLLNYTVPVNGPFLGIVNIDRNRLYFMFQIGYKHRFN